MNEQNPVVKPVTETINQVVNAEIVVPRKRGRPRKNPVVAAANPPRKRGRPRKSPLASNPLASF